MRRRRLPAAGRCENGVFRRPEDAKTASPGGKKCILESQKSIEYLDVRSTRLFSAPGAPGAAASRARSRKEKKTTRPLHRILHASGQRPGEFPENPELCSEYPELCSEDPELCSENPKFVS